MNIKPGMVAVYVHRPITLYALKIKIKSLI